MKTPGQTFVGCFVRECFAVEKHPLCPVRKNSVVASKYDSMLPRDVGAKFCHPIDVSPITNGETISPTYAT